MIATFHYDSQCWLLTDPTEATCTCGHTYYVDQGCPRCAKTVPHPFLLRDQCGTCGLPCSADWCPYCEGCHEGEEATNAARRATEFAVKQQEMLTAQLAARDRLITDLQAGRERLLNEVAGMRRHMESARDDAGRFRSSRDKARQNVETLVAQRDAANARNFDLTRQRDLAQADFELAHQRNLVLLDRIIALETLHATARRWVARLFLGGVGLAGAGALGWLWWDALRPVAAYLPGSRTWAEVLVVLALLLVLRWPVTRRREELTGNIHLLPADCPDPHALRCLGCGREADEGQPCYHCDTWSVRVTPEMAAAILPVIEELPGGNPGKLPRPAAPEMTGAGPTPSNTSAEQNSV